MKRLLGIGIGLLVCLCIGPGCEGDSGPVKGNADTSVAPDVPLPQPAVLGEGCLENSDCISGVCLRSEYGPPFCSRSCDSPGSPCDPGEDAAAGTALCVSYEDPPNPMAPVFKGDLEVFCVMRCQDFDTCEANNANWESCDAPLWLGDPIHPEIGSVKVCLAPSYQGKDPVDPSECDWERTVHPSFASQANLCRSYCEYLKTCKHIPPDTESLCCEWGCFNQMIVVQRDAQKVNDAWYDDVKCHLETHAAYPDVGVQNSCSEPPRQCCPDPTGKQCLEGYPVDPTPPAAE